MGTKPNSELYKDIFMLRQSWLQIYKVYPVDIVISKSEFI